VLLACAAVVLLTAWYAGASFPASAPAPAPGSVRLGPEPGEDVAAYLQRLPGELPAPGVEVVALVQFATELPPAAAATAVEGAVPVSAVLRVPVARVQTALRFEPLEQGVPAPAALDAARQQALRGATADARQQTGRPADIASAEERALADPAAPCVLRGRGARGPGGPGRRGRPAGRTRGARRARRRGGARTGPRPAAARPDRARRPPSGRRGGAVVRPAPGAGPIGGMGVYPRTDSVEILMSVSVRCWHGMRMTSTGGNGREAAGLAWAGESIVTASVIVALLPLGFLHLSTIGTLDPLTTVISDYVFITGGYALIGVAAISAAVGCSALAAGLRRADLPAARAPSALFVSAAVGLVLVALFPTHTPGTTPGLVSTVHRAAGGWVFAVLPLAAWMVARRARSAPAWAPAATPLTWATGIAGGVSAFFLLNHVPIVIAGSPLFPFIGGVQRVLYVAVMVVLVMTARATRLAVDRADCAVPVAVSPTLRGAS
jgi:hypothetical protein